MRIFSRQWFARGGGELKAYWNQGLTTLQDFFAHPWGNPQVAPTAGTAAQPTALEVYQQQHPAAGRGGPAADPVAEWQGRARAAARDPDQFPEPEV